MGIIPTENVSKLEALFNEKTSKCGLYAWSDRSTIIDKPILIVGLGGMGLSSVRSIKHEINSRLAGDDEKLPNLAYLAFDTEAGQRNKNYHGTKLDDDELEILTSAQTAAVYAAVKEGQHTHIGDWIRRDLDPNEITDEGAGGVRQFGRMLLFNRINEIKNKLINKINGLRKVSNPELGYAGTDDVLVFICAGVAGGTGSGSFIDMAYMIRYIIRNLVQVKANVINVGLLFLPDVTEGAAYGPRNGFAALKELNYLSNLGESGNKGRFSQNYGAFTVNDELPPYMYTLLISASQENGQRLSVGHAINMVAETVVNFIAGENVADGQDFSVLAYLNNTGGLRATFLNQVSETDKRPMLFRYLGSGTATAKLDLDGILIYLTNEMFKRMKDIYDRSPSDADINSFVSINGMGFNSLLSKFTKEKAFDNDKKKYLKTEYREIEENFTQTIEEHKRYLSLNYVGIKNEVLNNIKESLETSFKNMNKGPYYVSRLIYSGQAYDSLIKRLEGYLTKELRDPREAPDIEKVNTAETALNAERNRMTKGGLGGLFYPTGDYIVALINYANERLLLLAYEYTEKLIRDIRAYLSNLSESIYDVYTELIDIMTRVFRNNADILSKTGRTIEDNERGFYWEIVKLPELITGFQSIIDGDVIRVDMLDRTAGDNDNINLGKVIEKFLKNLLEESEKWLNIGNPDAIAKRLNGFVNNAFSKVMRKSIDMYLKLAIDDDNKVKAVIDNMFTRLKNQSQVMFPKKAGMPNYGFFDTAYVSVPRGIGSIIGKAQNNFPAPYNQVKESGIYDRVFILRNMSPLPVALYQNLEAYESSISTVSDSEGYHLLFGGIDGESLNWKTFLTSPNIGSLWSQSSHQNERYLRQIDMENRRLFKEAQELGYIVVRSEEVYCLYGACKEADDILGANGINGEQAINSASVSTAQSVFRAIETEFVNPNRKTEEAKLFNTMLTGATPNRKPQMDYASYIFLQMPDVVAKIKRMVGNHKELMRIKDLLNSAMEADKIYESAAKALITGIIYKDANLPKYYYFDAYGVEQEFMVYDASQFGELHYYLFNTFRNCDSGLRAYLTEKAEDEYVETSKNDKTALIRELINLKRLWIGVLPNEKDPNSVVYKLKLSKGMDLQSEKLTFYRETANKVDILSQMLGYDGIVSDALKPTPVQDLSDIICTKCKNKLPIDAKFCVECGEAVVVRNPIAVICVNCGEKVAAGKFCVNCGNPLGSKKCPQCDKELEADAKFCPECGAKV